MMGGDLTRKLEADEGRGGSPLSMGGVEDRMREPRRHLLPRGRPELEYCSCSTGHSRVDGHLLRSSIAPLLEPAAAGNGPAGVFLGLSQGSTYGLALQLRWLLLEGQLLARHHGGGGILSQPCSQPPGRARGRCCGQRREEHQQKRLVPRHHGSRRQDAASPHLSGRVLNIEAHDPLFPQPCGQDHPKMPHCAPCIPLFIHESSHTSGFLPLWCEIGDDLEPGGVRLECDEPRAAREIGGSQTS